ncbi:MAG: hypothetical protein U9O94_09730 [Nanoarchaeota archaeon]|nr:hypothetical protein [Nanoarchaeota archaeon]
MERMTTKEELIERLKDVRSVEIQARDHYIRDTTTFKHVHLVHTIKEIKEDEDRHIALLDELIQMLESS